MIFFARVVGVPAPQGSKSFKGMIKSKKTGRMVPRLLESSEKVGPWREAVVNATLRAKGELHFDCAVRLSLDFAMPRTKAMDKPSKKPKPTPYHITTPDLSKLVRSTEDALKDAGLLRDDARICQFGAVQKRYAEPGEATGCLIIVEALEPKESTHVEVEERPVSGPEPGKPRSGDGKRRRRSAGGDVGHLAL